ncbi:MAG: TonB-dependent receptor [Pseudomonadales bacterium]|nr:TonB-dependent receptor [Pseudomonadales bacterium]
MNKKRKGKLRLAVLSALATSAALGTSHQVFAQEGPLQEIVVTAQFREQNLQETPLAITALSGEAMTARSLTGITDVDSFAPNTVIQPLGAGWGSTAAAYIRGIGLGDNSLSFEPGVPIYIDDVYHGRPQGALFDLLDLERVEILRGPQGTLFGKNAIGGTVRMISKKPQGDNSGFVEATYGRFDRVDLRGSFDVSLLEDELFMRVSASSKRRDGYFNILDFECVNGPGSLGAGGTEPGLGTVVGPTDTRSEKGCIVDKLGEENVSSIRSAFRWLASDTVEVNVSVDYIREDNSGPADKFTIIDPTFGAGLTDLWNQLVAIPRYGVPFDDRFITDSNFTSFHRFGRDDITGKLVENVREMDQYGLSAVIDWDVSDNVHVKSITAYRDFTNTFGRDSDGSPLPEDITWDTSKHDQFSQEIQVTGVAFEDRLNWAFGGFYYNADDSNQGFNALFPLFFVAQNHKDVQETENWAVFAHGTYGITDSLSLTAGLRYTEDDKDTIIWRQDQLSLDIIIDNAPVSVSAEKVSPKVGLDYVLNDDMMVYGSWSTGFRGGGFGPRPSSVVQVESFGTEEAETWELGIKSDWFGQRLRLNTAFFYTDYTDQQSPAQDFDSEGNLWFRTINAGTTRIKGVELEALFQPIENLSIEATFGYLDFFRKDPGRSDLCTRDSNGKACPGLRSPKYSSSVGVNYDIPMANGSSLAIRADTVYQSKIWFSADDPIASDPSIGFQEGYTLLNARATWTSPNEDWTIAVFGTNLTDKEYFHGKLSLVGLLQRQQGNIASPREWGMSVKRTF